MNKFIASLVADARRLPWWFPFVAINIFAIVASR